MLWSPGLVDRPAPQTPQKSSATASPLEIYTSSLEPAQWGQRRQAAAYLLKELNPPLEHREQWEQVGAALEKASPPASAWQCWQQFSSPPPARGLFGPYQNRLSGLRRAQLQARAEQLRPILEKNDYAAYLEEMSGSAESRGPLGLALTLRPLSQIGCYEVLSYDLWWPILVNQSNDQALRAGLRLARGKTPEMPHRWEGRSCVCWSPGPDGKDDGGTLEASLESPPDYPVGDWIYRFR